MIREMLVGKNNSGEDSSHGTVFSYGLGFVLSLALTSLAFLLTHKHIQTHHLNPGDNMLLAILAVAAITQLFVQLVFFLHLDVESNRRWNLTVLAFAAIVVIIIVAGSIWIMSNLNYHHGSHDVTHDGHVLHSPQQTNQYIIHDEGINP